MDIDFSKLKNPIARGVFIESIPNEKVLGRARIRLDCKAPDKFDEPSITGVCRPTNLCFSLRFSPTRGYRKCSIRKKMHTPFILRCNMIPPKGQIRLHGYEDLMSSEDEVLIWLRENTNISQDTFDVALNNPYLSVPFCLNYGEYKKKTGTWVMIDYRMNNPYGGSDK